MEIKQENLLKFKSRHVKRISWHDNMHAYFSFYIEWYLYLNAYILYSDTKILYKYSYFIKIYYQYIEIMLNHVMWILHIVSRDKNSSRIRKRFKVQHIWPYQHGLCRISNNNNKCSTKQSNKSFSCFTFHSTQLS